MSHKLKITVPLALLITLVAVVYQRGTGPTYPKRFSFQYEGKKIRLKFPRSHETTGDAPVLIPLLGKELKPYLVYRRFPTNDTWSENSFEKTKNHWRAHLPMQPAAGKLEYYIQFKDDHGQVLKSLGSREAPILIRFKGPVSSWILIPHIFFMFFAMLLSSLSGLEAFFKTQLSRRLAFWGTGCLFIGGMILGPMVQKSAFGVYWAGFPFDWDLTDNKLLISFLVWLVASGMNLKKLRPIYMMVASVVLILMYSIPHSTMGSQYNYKKGQVETDR